MYEKYISFDTFIEGNTTLVQEMFPVINRTMVKIRFNRRQFPDKHLQNFYENFKACNLNLDFKKIVAELIFSLMFKALTPLEPSDKYEQKKTKIKELLRNYITGYDNLDGLDVKKE